MSTSALTPATRLAKAINSYVDTGAMTGGYVIASPDGSSGIWYSNDSNPVLAPGDFKVGIGRRRISIARAQRMLDEAARDAEE